LDAVWRGGPSTTRVPCRRPIRAKSVVGFVRAGLGRINPSSASLLRYIFLLLRTQEPEGGFRHGVLSLRLQSRNPKTRCDEGMGSQNDKRKTDWIEMHLTLPRSEAAQDLGLCGIETCRLNFLRSASPGQTARKGSLRITSAYS
jgi:hypothetical protein